MSDRKHQAELRNYVRAIATSDLPVTILADVVPGGGKSRLPGIIAEAFPDFHIGWFVPRLSLAEQAEKGMKKDFGVQIRASGNEINPTRGYKGFVATTHSLVSNTQLWVDELSRKDRKYILVVDEVHHGKIDRAGNWQKTAAALNLLPYKIRLLMTGTIETNDNTFVFGVPYKEVGKGWTPDLQNFDGKVIRYSREDAIQESAIVPVEFHYHDGPVKWENKDGIKESSLSRPEPGLEKQALMTALKTDLAEQLLTNCVTHWKKFGDKLLVVTADQSSAKRYAKTLSTQGIRTGIAISDEDAPQAAITEFRDGTLDCLVTCQMAYEGMDVPRITHIACLTNIRSKPWIIQMFARAWRASPGKKKCWIFVPNDADMNAVIELIRSEQERVIPFPINGPPPPPPTERIFIPISGEVAEVKAETLDGEPVEDEIETEIRSLFEKLGVPSSHPAIAEAIKAARESAIANPVPPKIEKTIAEQELYERRKIWDACNAADYQKGVEISTHMKKLNKALRYKSLTEMSLDELKEARRVCVRICS